MIHINKEDENRNSEEESSEKEYNIYKINSEKNFQNNNYLLSSKTTILFQRISFRKKNLYNRGN